MRYEDNPFVSQTKATGKKKLIGTYMCDEYILETDFRPNLLFYVTKEYPFMHKYNHPIEFPGFVVSSQGYAGNDAIIETIYEFRKAECSKEFNESIKEVRQLINTK